MFCAQGDVHFTSLKPGSYGNTREAKVFLTTNRLVATVALPLLLNIPFVLLVRSFMARQVCFDFPLTSVAVVEIGTDKTRHFVIWTRDGQQYSFKPINRLTQTSYWVSAIVHQVKIAQPNAIVITEGRSTFFQLQ